VSDEKIINNTKVALEEMFSTEREHKLKKDGEEKFYFEEESNQEPYPKKFTFLVSLKNYKDFHDVFFRRKLSGDKINKMEFFNEVIEFYVKHHKSQKKEEKQ
jgi:hypothetical protein